MLALRGIYQDGQIRLDQSVYCNKPVAVIVTFLEDEPILEQHPIPAKINSLQAAIEELRTVCAEENYEWQIPERQNRLVEF